MTGGKLPIDRHKEEVFQLLDSNQCILVCGETGSGKTTQVPKWSVFFSFPSTLVLLQVCRVLAGPKARSRLLHGHLHATAPCGRHLRRASSGRGSRDASEWTKCPLFFQPCRLSVGSSSRLLHSVRELHVRRDAPVLRDGRHVATADDEQRGLHRLRDRRAGRGARTIDPHGHSDGQTEGECSRSTSQLNE